jgi:hypothetical protein
MKERKRPWAPWKMALLVLGVIMVVGLTVGILTIPASAAHYDARVDRYTQGLAQMCLVAVIVAYLVQYRRVSRWNDDANASASAAPRIDATGETILAESPSRRVGTLSGLLNGRLIVTPRRIVFFAGSVRELDIELASITATARTRWRVSGKVLDVTLADGTTHRIIVDRFDSFAAQLGPALARARAA